MKTNNLLSKQFIPLFITQFFGAFNDNLFKNALVISITFGIIQSLGLSLNTSIQLIGATFILPFVLFSSLAGQIADKYEKSNLILKLKIFEVFLAVLGSSAIYFHHFSLSFITLFGLGLQATLFGPLKYSILPQHVLEEDLIAANSFIEAGTFISILIGTIIGGLYYNSPLFYILLITCSVIGLFSASKIPQAPAGDAQLKINFNLFSSSLSIIKESRKSLAVFRSVLAISWFWLLGSSLLAIFPYIVKTIMQESEVVITLLLATFSVGIAIGSVVCEKLAQKKVEIGLVPVGALGMTIFGFKFADVLKHYHVTTSTFKVEQLSSFLNMPADLNHLIFNLFFISFFGGFFIVPLYALLQERTDKEVRSRVVAANNIINSFFMVLGAAYAILFHQFGFTKTQYIESLFVLNAVVSLYVFITVPEFFFRFVAWCITNFMYRINTNGGTNFPKEGGALIISNHVSFMDGLLIFGACPRPAKFVMYYKIYNIPFLKPIFKAVGAVPIASKNEDPKVLKAAFDEIERTLKNGELIVIFPEGEITKTGSMIPFKPGILKILNLHNVPVIPCALNGLYGSMFSRKEKSIFRFIPKSFFSRTITLNVGKSISYNKQENFLDDAQKEVEKLMK